MTNEEAAEDGVQKRSSNNNDESKRKSDRETEGEKHMQYQLLH